MDLSLFKRVDLELDLDLMIELDFGFVNFPFLYPFKCKRVTSQKGLVTFLGKGLHYQFSQL